MNVARTMTAALFAIAAAACSSSSAPAGGAPVFPADPYATATSTNAHLAIEVRTAPTQPPPRGTFDVELRIADTSGAPVDGLTVSVTPWMPAMGHGASVTPTVTAEGGGRYLLTNVSLFMPGSWQLRTTIGGAVNDDVTPIVDVP